MNTGLRLLGTLMLLSVGAAYAADLAEHHRTAGDKCEAAVADTVRRLRGRDAQEVEFFGAKRAIAPTSGEQELGVKGEGRYHAGAGAGMAFAYSCAFNTQTGGTSGVLLRESATPAGADPAWQPDLSSFSPEACEAATAAALTAKHPRAGAIAFDSGTRQLLPAAHDHTHLEGRGALVRAPGMLAAPFSYRCEFETTSGKVVAVQTRE
jgi:hypothetical protein